MHQIRMGTGDKRKDTAINKYSSVLFCNGVTFANIWLWIESS